MSNLTEQNNNETKFVHFTTEVHKIMLRNTVKDCIVTQHLAVLTPDNLLFSSLNTAFWLMGLNAYKVNPQLFTEFIKVLDQYKLSKLKSTDDEMLNKAAKKIIKKWKQIIEVSNLKNEVYAD